MTEPGIPTQAAAAKARRRPAVVLVAAVLAAALTARLGLWQLDRAAEKIAMESQIDERARLPQLRSSELANDETGASTQYGRIAHLRGRWMADKTVYLDNRVMNGRVGFFVVTPLLLEDGSSLLVERGWVPRSSEQRTRLPAFDTSTTTVEVAGRLALTLSRLYQLGAPASGPIRQNVDLTAFARETGLALRPFVLVQLSLPGEVADGLERQWARPASDVGRNYGYAFQWFALCLLVAGLYIWFQLVKPRLPQAEIDPTERPTEHHSGH